MSAILQAARAAYAAGLAPVPVENDGSKTPDLSVVEGLSNDASQRRGYADLQLRGA